MSEENVPTAGRRPFWVAGGIALLVVLALVIAFGLFRQGPNGDPEVTSTPDPTPTLPPQEPVELSGTTSLTVPEEGRFADGTFEARAGTTYLVTFVLDTEKPEGSDGYAMYLGVTLGCGSDGGDVAEHAGGTQNLLTGEPTTYENQLLFTAETDGVVSCSLKVSAPYDDVAAAGTTFDLAAQWRAEPVLGAAYEPSSAARLPMTIPSGERKFAFSQRMPLEDLSGVRLRSLTSLHMTTCTVVNGSREAGRAWCAEDDLDERGSDVVVETKIDLLAEDGTVCDAISTATSPVEHVSLYRHHHLISQELEAQIPTEPCGTEARVTVMADNKGPAPLVIHENNSSLVVVGNQEGVAED